MKPINYELLKMRLYANAEANQRAAYFLMNHVVRDDNHLIVAAAKRLAFNLQKRAIANIKKIENLP